MELSTDPVQVSVTRLISRLAVALVRLGNRRYVALYSSWVSPVSILASHTGAVFPEEHS